MSDEEKKAIERIDYIQDFIIENGQYNADVNDMEYFSKVLNIIEKQSKEIEKLKADNKEIREWKYVIDNPIDLKKLSELDIIKIFGKSYIAKDIIKARIKELEEYLYKGNIKDDFLMIRIKAKIQELQSLLEKE